LLGSGTVISTTTTTTTRPFVVALICVASTPAGSAIDRENDP
jgi:hypothetical protein